MIMNLQLQINYHFRMNLALLQNKVPLVRAIYLKNTGDTPFEGLKLKITSDPEDVLSFETNLSSIAVEEEFVVMNPDIKYSALF